MFQLALEDLVPVRVLLANLTILLLLLLRFFDDHGKCTHSPLSEIIAGFIGNYKQ